MKPHDRRRKILVGISFIEEVLADVSVKQGSLAMAGSPHQIFETVLIQQVMMTVPDGISVKIAFD